MIINRTVFDLPSRHRDANAENAAVNERAIALIFAPLSVLVDHETARVVTLPIFYRKYLS
jgi:hypothetical protein